MLDDRPLVIVQTNTKNNNSEMKQNNVSRQQLNAHPSLSNAVKHASIISKFY